MGDQQAIEGEIIPPEAKKKHWNSDGNGRNAYVDGDVVDAVIADRVSGMTLRQVGEKWGISHQTVHNWCGGDLKNRKSADVAEKRAHAAQQLAVARGEAWKIYRAAKDRGLTKVMDNALIRIESITMAMAKLEGAIAPVRVDLTVTELTAAEQELQEMLNEAAAKAAAEEQAVIDAANADPDL